MERWQEEGRGEITGIGQIPDTEQSSLNLSRVQASSVHFIMAKCKVAYLELMISINDLENSLFI